MARMLPKELLIECFELAADARPDDPSDVYEELAAATRYARHLRRMRRVAKDWDEAGRLLLGRFLYVADLQAREVWRRVQRMPVMQKQRIVLVLAETQRDRAADIRALWRTIAHLPSVKEVVAVDSPRDDISIPTSVEHVFVTHAFTPVLLCPALRSLKAQFWRGARGPVPDVDDLIENLQQSQVQSLRIRGLGWPRDDAFDPDSSLALAIAHLFRLQQLHLPAVSLSEMSQLLGPRARACQSNRAWLRELDVGISGCVLDMLDDDEFFWPMNAERIVLHFLPHSHDGEEWAAATYTSVDLLEQLGMQMLEMDRQVLRQGLHPLPSRIEVRDQIYTDHELRESIPSFVELCDELGIQLDFFGRPAVIARESDDMDLDEFGDEGGGQDHDILLE